MEIYGELDRREYWNPQLSWIRKKRQKPAPPIFENALSKEVEVRRSTFRPFIDMLLGKVIKCRLEKLENRTGITPDCMLYRNYRLQYQSGSLYESGLISESEREEKNRLLEEEIEQCRAQKKPQEELQKECIRLLGLEKLGKEWDTYLEWLLDIRQVKEKTREKGWKISFSETQGTEYRWMGERAGRRSRPLRLPKEEIRRQADRLQPGLNSRDIKKAGRMAAGRAFRPGAQLHKGAGAGGTVRRISSPNVKIRGQL